MIGVTTKLGINECWIALFLENERRFKAASGKRPRTDRELAAFMKQEFPERDHSRYVAKARWRYNNAKLYLGQKPPKVRSYRYSYVGKRIGAREFDPTEPRPGEQR